MINNQIFFLFFFCRSVSRIIDFVWEATFVARIFPGTWFCFYRNNQQWLFLEFALESKLFHGLKLNWFNKKMRWTDLNIILENVLFRPQKLKSKLKTLLWKQMNNITSNKYVLHYLWTLNLHCILFIIITLLTFYSMPLLLR